MELNLEEDIRSVTELKRQTKEILAQANTTQRPIIITVNGRADTVLVSAAAFEKMKLNVSAAQNLQSAPVPQPSSHPELKVDPMNGQTFRSFKQFWQEFKDVYKVDA